MALRRFSESMMEVGGRTLLTLFGGWGRRSGPGRRPWDHFGPLPEGPFRPLGPVWAPWEGRRGGGEGPVLLLLVLLAVRPGLLLAVLACHRRTGRQRP